MFFPGFFTALVVAILLAAVFSLFLDRRGPWGGVVWFFLLIFLAAWAAGTWVTPVGPVWMGVSWVPFFIGALAVALLLAALSEPRPRTAAAEARTDVEAEEAQAVGFFFWLLILLLVVLIVLGAF